jgi:hypothetical protein
MALAPVHRKLLIGQALGSVACNIPLNAALAWVTFPSIDAMPMWAIGNCVGGDTIGTGFFLPLITCLIMTPITRRLVRRGAVPAIPRQELPGFIRFWPENFVGRGALAGLVGTVTVALPLALVLAAADVQSMTRVEVTIYKAVYTTLFGLIVAPLFGWRALADAPA